MNNDTDVLINQVHDPIGRARHFGVWQDALLAMQLADHEKYVPPMGL